MNKPCPDNETIIDFVTGAARANCGAEANRQQIERLLVEKLGYDPTAIEVDAPITMELDGQRYTSTVDLVIKVRGHRYMAIKCAAGSLASRDREVIAAARLLENLQIPLAIASDGKTAMVWDSVTGESLGTGLDAIPSADRAREQFDPEKRMPLDEKRRYRQMLIFRTYDAMNVHR